MCMTYAVDRRNPAEKAYKSVQRTVYTMSYELIGSGSGLEVPHELTTHISPCKLQSTELNATIL